MQYKTYSAEFKMAMIDEYVSRDITIRAFAKEKDIGLSTFESWLTKLRKAGQLGYKKDKAAATSEALPIDITKEAREIVNDIYDCLDSVNAEEGTPLDAAVKYFRNVREESRTFLLDGHIPISNNVCERAIRPFAIMRRNVLFAKTEKGASISGRIFTIVQTAKANALVVDKYLEYALENISKVSIEDLLPWSEKLPKELSIKQYVK